MNLRIIQILFVLFCLPVSPLRSQDMDIPLQVQYPLFLKVLLFDSNLEERCGDEIIIGIVYQGKNRKSTQVMKSLRDIIEKSQIKNIRGLPVSCVLITMNTYNLATISFLPPSPGVRPG